MVHRRVHKSAVLLVAEKHRRPLKCPHGGDGQDEVRCEECVMLSKRNSEDTHALISRVEIENRAKPGGDEHRRKKCLCIYCCNSHTIGVAISKHAGEWCSLYPQGWPPSTRPDSGTFHHPSTRTFQHPLPTALQTLETANPLSVSRGFPILHISY